MNKVLHGCPIADIRRRNTLANPHFQGPAVSLKTFDFAVPNPRFSAKSWSNGLDPAHDEFGRFELGVPPAKNGDYAFLLHVVKSLKSTGKGAVILPHGVLFRGHAEANIRRNLVRRGYIKGIIGLPPNLFYGTGIPACVIVLDKEHTHARRGIFMIDASRGFMKDGNKNRLRSQDIHKIVDVFNRQTELPRYSRMVGFTEIEANDFNLNIPRYIDSSEPEDLHDLDAHLNGGIPERDIDALADYWRIFPTLRQTLFAAGDRPGYSHARVPAPEVKASVLGHPEFAAFAGRVQAVFDGWRAAHERGILRRDPRERLPGTGQSTRRVAHTLCRRRIHFGATDLDAQGAGAGARTASNPLEEFLEKSSTGYPSAANASPAVRGLHGKVLTSRALRQPPSRPRMLC